MSFGRYPLSPVDCNPTSMLWNRILPGSSYHLPIAFGREASYFRLPLES